MKDLNPPIWNPFRKGYLDDPHEQLRFLRREKPVHKGVNGRWIILKYDDVKFVLPHPLLKTAKVSDAIAAKSRLLDGQGNFDQLSEASAQWMLFFDPPEHTEMRSLLAKIWNKYKIQDDIRAIVEEGIELMARETRVDIVNGFATFVPARVMCRVLGLPPEDYIKFKVWSHCLNSMLEPFSTLYDFVYYNEQAKEFYAYLSKIIRAKTEKPDDAFISQFLIANEKLPEPLNDSEVISVIAFLFFAGIETSVNLFGQSVMLLCKHPEQAQLLRDDESIAPKATEELLRYVSPSQYTTRIASEDIEIRGQQIKAGDYIMAATVSANRDPDVFEDPERLDLTRQKNPHLGFGYGLHYCLGAKLARDELTIALPAFVNRFPKVELDPQNPYEWDKIIVNRGLKTLPIVLGR